MRTPVKHPLGGLVSLALCLMLLIAPHAFVHADSNPPVRVGFFAFDGYHMQSATGAQSGYGYDIVQYMSGYTDLRFEFIGYEKSWADAQEMLARGEIDMLTSAQKTPQRMERFDFSDRSIGVSSAILTVKAGNASYSLGGYSSWSGMRVGMIKGNSRNDRFAEFAVEHGFTYTAVDYDDTEEMLAALMAGRDIDAVVTSNLRRVDGEWILAQFDPSPFYIMVRKGDETLLGEINAALDQLYTAMPSIDSLLMSKYYLTNTGDNIAFTLEENALIKASQTNPIPIGILLSGEPVCYEDASGEYVGISMDILRAISGKTGLAFRYVPVESGSIPLDQIKAGNLTLASGIIRTPTLAADPDMILSSEIMTDSIAVIGRRNDDFTEDAQNKTIAISAGFKSGLEYVKDNFPEHRIALYPGFDECLRAVARGEADAAVYFRSRAAYALMKPLYEKLAIIPSHDLEFSYCVAGLTPEHDELISIINKGDSMITESERNAIMMNYTVLHTYQLSFGDTVYKYRFPLIIIVVLTLLIFALTVVFTLKTRQRRLLDDKRRQHNEFLQHLYDTLPCGVFRYAYEAPHKILSYNASCARIYGFDGEFPVVGETPDSVVEAGTEEAFQREFDRCEKAGKPISYIWPITRADGSLAYTESVMDIVETEQGKIFQEIIIDVTERTLREKEIERQYSQELQRRNMRGRGLLYLTCFDITEQILAETDIDVPGIHIGMSIEESVDVLSGELSALQSDEAMRDLATRFTAERMEKEYENGQYEQSFLLCRVKDNQPQWLRSDLALRRNPANNHLMCFDYIWDVTDEQITNEIVRRMAFADCESFMTVYLPTGRCLQYTVESRDKLTRLDADYGQSNLICAMTARMTPEDARELLEATALPAVVQRLDSGERHQVYATLSDEHGNRQDKALTFFYTDREKGLLAVTISDVTEVRRDEVRHAALLSDALAAAERADVAKSQFLSSVSHEMRTPLNAIIGFMELAKGSDEKTMANYLASSDIAAKQLLSVINDVLDMSSIESGKLKIAQAPFNFRRLITSITNVYGNQCKQKGVMFSAQIITPIEDWLVGDEMRVNQILMNLLGNAVKFTAEGTIRLTISKTEVGGDKVFVRFVISDTGCGMSAEMQARLFMPFEQESALTAKKHGGSGLGLSIVKSLAGLMGGMVRVDSKQGEGSTFTVDLPFSRCEEKADATLHKRVDHLRVLVVDDEESARAYMGTVLERMGVRYACAGSGSEALVAMEASEREHDLFNICLIDWRMPVPDGVQTTSLIRKRYGEDIMVIVVSAYDYQQASESAKAAGANLILSKPVFQSALFDLFMTLTDGKIAKPVEEAQSWDFTGKRVLLAEDNELNQIVAMGYLERCGITADLAEDGQAVVDKFVASAPGWYDAILMDVQMPVQDGLAATRAIRESTHPQAKTILIIAQTANAFNEDIAKALSAGMNAHVSKPIDPDALYRTLAAGLSSKKADAMVEAPGASMPAPAERGLDTRALAAVGVDCEGGVRRFRGKPAMYEKYLLRFLQSDPLTALYEQLCAGDCDAAFRVVHDLKGTTGNLCMDRLFGIVCDLTERLRAKVIDESTMHLYEQARAFFDDARKAAFHQ